MAIKVCGRDSSPLHSCSTELHVPRLHKPELFCISQKTKGRNSSTVIKSSRWKLLRWCAWYQIGRIWKRGWGGKNNSRFCDPKSLRSHEYNSQGQTSSRHCYRDEAGHIYESCSKSRMVCSFNWNNSKVLFSVQLTIFRWWPFLSDFVHRMGGSNDEIISCSCVVKRFSHRL